MYLTAYSHCTLLRYSQQAKSEAILLLNTAVATPHTIAAKKKKKKNTAPKTMAILKTLTAPRLPIVQLEPFTPTAFAPFGTCIEAPLTTRAGNRPEHEQACSTADAIVANQGTARKHARVSAIRDFYPATDPPASQQLHVFSCAPRTLPRSGVFAVRILERHPFTTQTFVPLAVGDDDAYFVVIVAPTATDSDAGWPDLRRLRAFRARPGQAVTYNAGTWHAPMVVLRARVDFVVVVAENGTARDCEEVEIVAADADSDADADADSDADADADGGVGVKVKVVVDDGNWGLWAEGKRMRNGKARL